MITKLIQYKKMLFAPGATALTLALMLWVGSSHTPNLRCNPQAPMSVPGITQANVVFDLHGVLFKISKKKALSQLGFFDMLSYTLTGNSADNLEELMFALLHRLNGDDQATFCTEDALVPKHRDKPLPYLMCEWMRGGITGKEIIEQLLPLIDTLSKEKFFKSSLEKRLIKKIANIMFDPSVRHELYKPLKKGVALLQECKELGHRVFLLSNMDADLIERLQETHPDIFALFDDMIISADARMIKPDADIYQHAITKFGLSQDNTYFLDDQEENVEGALRVGLRGIKFTNKSAKSVRKELIRFGVLPAKHTADDDDEESEIEEAVKTA